MAQSFFFYDLETSGFNPREARIMQFAGQRTDMDLQPMGEPVNVLIKMSEDTLPDADAVLITGLTPQSTLQDGLSEAEFLKLFQEEVATSDTIFVGYNTVRFDDEFMRYLHYRNFYDPYEWQWQDGKSKWDLLDVVRMTRALRPEGIEWPFDAKGVATNRLELLASLNKLDHYSAHDALSDVKATIALAQLIKTKQPKLFDFLLNLRDKKQLAVFTATSKPFLYTSGKYPGEFEKTTVVTTIADHPKRAGVLVYDLRIDPTPFKDLKSKELAEAWQYHKDEDGETSLHLPVKTLQFNHCPAVAPLSVLDKASQERLKIAMDMINENHKLLQAMTDFPKRLLEAQAILDKKQDAKYAHEQSLVDAQLYNGFFAGEDKQMMSVVRAAEPAELKSLEPLFKDKRLAEIFPLYKARNFPSTLTEDEHIAWEEFRTKKLMDGNTNSRFAKFAKRIADIVAAGGLTAQQEFLMEELQLWGESIMPVAGDE